MNFIRGFLFFVIYAAACWHAYAIIGRPFLSVGISAPLPAALISYSQQIRMYPAWSFFAVYPDANIRIDYRVDGRSENIPFYVRGEGYLDLMQFYRCGACSNAAYQFYLKNYVPGYPWLAGKFICGLNPDAGSVTVVGRKAHFSSQIYEDFKQIEIKCVR